MAWISRRRCSPLACGLRLKPGDALASPKRLPKRRHQQLQQRLPSWPWLTVRSPRAPRSHERLVGQQTTRIQYFDSDELSRTRRSRVRSGRSPRESHTWVRRRRKGTPRADGSSALAVRRQRLAYDAGRVQRPLPESERAGAEQLAGGLDEGVLDDYCERAAERDAARARGEELGHR